MTTVINKQDSTAEKQEVLNSTLVFLNRIAAASGLEMSVKKAVAGVENKDEASSSSDSDSSDSTSDDDDLPRSDIFIIRSKSHHQILPSVVLYQMLGVVQYSADREELWSRRAS